MKKILIATLIMSTLSMVGCGSNKEIEELKVNLENLKKENTEQAANIESLQKENEELKQKVDETSILEELKKENEQLQEKINELENTVKNEPQVAVKENETAKVTIKQAEYLRNSDEAVKVEIENFKKKYKEQGKNPIAITGYGNEYMEVIESTQTITNIKHHEMDMEKLSEYESKIDEYMKNYGLANTGTEILAKLTPNDVLLMPMTVGEGIPQHLISWTDSNGKVNYAAISYNGVGD